MADLQFRCVALAPRSLSRTLESFRSGIAANTSRISDLEASYLSLNAAITTLNGTFRVAQSEDQLREYVGEGGLVFSDGEIELSNGPIEITQEATRLFGLPGSSIINPSVAGQDTDIIRVKAPDVWIHGLELTTNHPLNTDDFDVAIHLDNAISFDVSGLIVANCNIHHVATGIWKAGSVASIWAERVKILHNHIHAFREWGIAMSYRFRGLLIDDNHIQGRDSGQTHDVNGNCIWLAAFMDHTTISRNRCSESDRNGIELYADLAHLGSNVKGQVIQNRVEAIDSIGISAFGTDSVLIENNQVSGALVIGIEIYNSVSTLGENIVRGNHVRGIGPSPGSASPMAGISIDQVTKATVSGNVIENIISDTGVDSAGIQIGNGCRNTILENNKFVDAGTRMIWVNGDGVEVYDVITLKDNTFLYTSDYITTYPPGDFSYWPAIELNSVSTAVVKNNTVYYPSAVPSFGLMQILNSGSAYVGNALEAPVSPATGGSHLRGSNIRVPY